MSDRITLLGAERLATVTNIGRETLLGAEHLDTVVNTGRETLLGVEYLYTPLATCTAEFIQPATTGDVQTVSDDVAAIEAADVLLGHASAAFPSGRIPTDTSDVEWDLATANQAKANLSDSGVTADTYGDATHVPQITVDAKGRVTGVTDVAISGVSGGSSPAWVTDSPNTPPASPNAADDEFGGTDYSGETALDTGGTRFTGATAWQWRNQGTSTATIDSGNGVLILTPQENGQVRGVEQAVPTGSWTIRARISCRVDLPASNSVILGMYGVNNSNGKLIVATLANISGGLTGLYSSVWNSVSSWSADRKTPANSDPVHSMAAWFEAEYDGTTLTFRVSNTGHEGTFSTFVAETVASFLGGLTHIGLCGYADGGAPNPVALVCDAWRRVA